MKTYVCKTHKEYLAFNEGFKRGALTIKQLEKMKNTKRTKVTSNLNLFEFENQTLKEQLKIDKEYQETLHTLCLRAAKEINNLKRQVAHWKGRAKKLSTGK